MENKIRWGVIGAGGIADRRTIPGMMLCGNAELVAVMEINQELAEKCRAKWNCKKAYTSAEALLADPEIDAVYIASPVALHAAQAMAAADTGKHVLIEKPLALTAAEGQKVVDYCAEKGIQIAAGFMMRFGAYAQAMKAAITERKIGRPVSASAVFSCWYPDIPGSWRQTKAHGGGGSLMDMGVHCIDLIQYVMGSKVVSVSALCDTLSFHYEVEDSATLLMKLENGAHCVVQSNFNIPDSASASRLHIFGDGGQLLAEGILDQVDGGTLDALFTRQDAYDAQQNKKREEKADISVVFGNMYTREIESFSNSLLTGAPLEVPAQDAVDVQRIVEAAYRAAEEGITVTL